MAESDIERFRAAIDTLVRVFKVGEGQVDGGLRVPPTDALTLLFIGDNPQCMSSDLARFLAVAPTTASSIVDRLVRKGWLLRKPAEANRRAVSLSVSEEGAAVVSLLLKRQLADCRVMLSALQEPERKEFIRLISKVAQASETSVAAERLDEKQA